LIGCFYFLLTEGDVLKPLNVYQVRNPELRPIVLDKGSEELVRMAKRLHPKTCGDVGAAALRDMGLDNYND
jgi:hypothetical protein